MIGPYRKQTGGSTVNNYIGQLKSLTDSDNSALWTLGGATSLGIDKIVIGGELVSPVYDDPNSEVFQGVSYIVTIKVENYVAGSLQIMVGLGTASEITGGGNGFFQVKCVAGASKNKLFACTFISPYQGDITFCSVKQMGGLTTKIGGNAPAITDTIDFAVSGGMAITRNGEIHTLQGHNFSQIPLLEKWLNVDGGSTNPQKQINKIIYFEGDTHGANSGLIDLNGWNDLGITSIDVAVTNILQLGLAQIGVTAGAVDPPTIIVPDGKQALTRGKGSMITCIWLGSSGNVLVMGDLADI